MSTLKKGLNTSCKEWAVHLRPDWKRMFWSSERKATQKDIRNRLKNDD